MRKIKKVLLIHPEISRTKYNFAGVIDNESLELEYIASLLNNISIEYDIWDGQVEIISAAEKICDFQPDLVYICGRARQENFMLEYCRYAKEICKSLTVLGGLHAQHCFERLYKPEVDYILTSFDIFNLIKIINNENPENLNSICYKQDGIWIANPAEPFDINKLPVPDRSYFYAHTDRYRYLELLPCAHVRTSYCCPYRCSFCSRNRLNCGVYTFRDIADVVDEIENINVENIYFIDDDFLFDQERIKKFISLISERGIKKKYVCYGRADFISAHPELIKELKQIGFYYILTGLEALDDRYLENYNKKTNIKVNEAAVRIVNESGINLMGMFITDLDFAPSDFRNMYRWIKKHKLSHAAVSIFTPELCSEMYEKYKNRIVTDNPEAWDYLHVVAKPDKMSVSFYYFHYHILMVRLFLRGYRDGIYDFIDYGYYIKSFIKNMFKFGG